MLDWNMQSGRELLVVFAVLGDGGKQLIPSWGQAGSCARQGSPPGTGYLAEQDTSSLVQKPGEYRNQPLFLIFVSCPSPLRLEQGLAYFPILGNAKIQNAVVQGCMFGFCFLWFVNRLGMYYKMYTRLLGSWKKPFSVAEGKRWLSGKSNKNHK